MAWLWSLSFFLIAYSCVPDTGNSEEVTSLKGSQGSDVVFRLDQKIGNDIQKIMWISTSKHLILVNISAGESTNCITNNTQFKERLSVLPDKSLILHNLKTEDNGSYEAEIKSIFGEITTQKFNLTVLENESTNFNKNLCIIVAVVIVLAFVGILAYVICRKSRGPRFSCLSRKGEPYTEENGRCKMASSQTNKERLRMLDRAFPVITIQENVVEMRNGLGTQRENSRNQQELSDEEENNTESMDHRRTTQNLWTTGGQHRAAA